ncbi:unnamed protein product, partial [Ectocarpus sp. 8 AP-2014]
MRSNFTKNITCREYDNPTCDTNPRASHLQERTNHARREAPIHLLHVGQPRESSSCTSRGTVLHLEQRANCCVRRSMNFRNTPVVSGSSRKSWTLLGWRAGRS